MYAIPAADCYNLSATSSRPSSDLRQPSARLSFNGTPTLYLHQVLQQGQTGDVVKFTELSPAAYLRPSPTSAAVSSTCSSMSFMCDDSFSCEAVAEGHTFRDD